MKLREFNAENTTSVRGLTTVARVSINTKTGLFCFNKVACDLMGLNNNDQIQILQDEEDPETWYLEKVKSKGFVVRGKGNVTAGLLFNNTTVARQIADSVAFTDQSGRILIAGDPTKFEKRTLWGLLTTSLRNK